MSEESVQPWDAIDEVLVDGTRVHARFTTRAAGDFAVAGPPDALAARRMAVIARPWAWMRQVHGTTVVDLDADVDDLEEVNGSPADAMITRSTGIAVSVTIADCAPVILWGSNGVLAAVHAGWKGVSGGLIDATVAAMQRAGAGDIRAVIGPCIAPATYEFGAADLDLVADRLGPDVRASTTTGAPALDLRAAVGSALRRSGADLHATVGGDTAAEPERYFSHRARGETERQVGVAWLEAP
jgi:YfiH family protein